jgi:hypothetical protein
MVGQMGRTGRCRGALEGDQTVPRGVVERHFASRELIATIIQQTTGIVMKLFIN